jgi:hypothetical protein
MDDVLTRRADLRLKAPHVYPGLAYTDPRAEPLRRHDGVGVGTIVFPPNWLHRCQRAFGRNALGRDQHTAKLAIGLFGQRLSGYDDGACFECRPASGGCASRQQPARSACRCQRHQRHHASNGAGGRR